MESSRSPRATLAWRRPASLVSALLLSVCAVLSCSTPTTTTPTRALDRPSDVALYCVDYEVPNCLPTGIDPIGDPEGYLAAYCGQVDYAAHQTPTATVLPLDECEESAARGRVERYLGAVERAALAVGRDISFPCCAAGTAPCDTKHPVCSRRMVSALVANTARGELAVADVQLRSPGPQRNGLLRSLHGGKPGFGFLPAGLLPEHVRTFAPAQDGPGGQKISPAAWGVTSNAGSCNLSVLSLQPVAQLAARADICDEPDQWCAGRDCSADTCPLTLQPYLPGMDGRPRDLKARPSWVEVAPWSDGVRRVALVAYPTCGMVAAIDLGNTNRAGICRRDDGCGRVLDAVGFDQSGKPYVMTATDLAKLTCAADCGQDTSGGLMPDPSTIPAGGVGRVPAYPAHLAVETVTPRLLIGAHIGSGHRLLRRAHPGGSTATCKR